MILRPAMSRLRSSVLHFALATASFAVVAGFVRALVPWPEGSGLPLKVDHFKEHKDEFDALFFGSSRTFRGLDNKLIDQKLAERGIAMRSFSFAVGGMGAFEQDFLFRQVLAMRPARLKWVFYEGAPVGVGVRADHIFNAPNNLWTEREVYWHSGSETARALGAIRRLPVPLRRKLALAAVQVQHMGWKLCNYGKGTSILRQYWRSEEDREARAEMLADFESGGGHQGLEEATGQEVSKEMPELLADAGSFEKRIASIPAENHAPIPLEEINLAIYREHYRLADEHGARLIYYLLPQYESSPEQLRLHEAGIIPVLLNYNDPERYPELFRLDHRFDKGHLNRRGVVAFSERIAQAIGDLILAERAAENHAVARGGAERDLE